jgi:hypothetical protein
MTARPQIAEPTSAEDKMRRMLSGLIPGRGTAKNQAEAENHHRAWIGLFQHYREQKPHVPFDVILALVLIELYERKLFRGKAPRERMPRFRQVEKIVKAAGMR